MAHHKAQKKSIKRSARLNVINRGNRSKLRTAVRVVLASTKPEEALVLKNSLFSQADKAALNGLIHRNKAARIKSRAARALNALSAAPQAAPKA